MNILQQSAFDIDLNIDPGWCNWFVGWVDAEGYFFGGREKKNSKHRGINCGLRVSVRDDDAKLVYSVRDMLRCGRISFPKVYNGSNPQISWCCNDFGSCRNVLIPIFDAYPLHSKKMRDYEIWRALIIAVSDGHHLNNNRGYVLQLGAELKNIKKYKNPNTGIISMNNSEPDDNWRAWFSGWIDGEGYFQIQPSKRDRGIGCALRVHVRDDDVSLIHDIMETLHCGGISHRTGSASGKPSIEWHCYNIDSCRSVLIPIFDKYPLRSKKARDYKIWRDAVIEISDKHYKHGERKHVWDLYKQLLSTRKYIPQNIINA